MTTAIEVNADEDTEVIEQRDRGVVENEDDKGNHSKSNSNHNAEVHNVIDDNVTSVDVDYTDHKILRSVCEVTEAETSRLDHGNVLEVTDQWGHNDANNDLNVLSNVLDVTKVTEMKHPQPKSPKSHFYVSRIDNLEVDVPPDVPQNDQPKKMPPNPLMIREDLSSLRDASPSTHNFVDIGIHEANQNEQIMIDGQMRVVTEVDDDDDEQHPEKPEKRKVSKEIDLKTEKSNVFVDKKPIFDSPIRGRIKKGTVGAIKEAFDRLAAKEDDERNLKRLSRSCLKPLRSGNGSGKKKKLTGSRRVRQKINLPSDQALISDFYPRTGGEEQGSGNS